MEQEEGRGRKKTKNSTFESMIYSDRPGVEFWRSDFETARNAMNFSAAVNPVALTDLKINEYDIRLFINNY